MISQVQVIIILDIDAWRLKEIKIFDILALKIHDDLTRMPLIMQLAAAMKEDDVKTIQNILDEVINDSDKSKKEQSNLLS